MKFTGKKTFLSLQIGLIIAILILLNVLSSKIFKRIDLTEDGRFTVSEVSKELLHKLKGKALITVYYDGDMPIYYKNLRNDLETFLVELSNVSGGELNYQFIDPAENTQLFVRFRNQGLYPFELITTNELESREKWILPYIEINYNQQKRFVNLIQESIYRRRDGKLDFSVEKATRMIEYKLISELYNMGREKNKTIGLLTGHAEYPREAMGDLFREIDPYYNFVNVDLRQGRAIYPEQLDLLIALAPRRALSEREKYELDQFLMRGGKMIWLLEQENIDFSIGEQESTLTQPNDINMTDFFMKHGVKPNFNLVLSEVCGQINAQTFTTTFGSDSRAKKWVFYPIITNFPKHPSTRYISNVLLRNVSSIDTFFVPGIHKTAFLVTDPLSQLINGSAYLNINQELRIQRPRSSFNAGPQITGIFLGGTFNSLFKGRKPPVDSITQRPPRAPFLAQSRPSPDLQVAIISDGEFAIADRIKNRYMELPADNKRLMMNLIDIMSGQDLLSKLRIRDIKIQRLDQEKYKGWESQIRIVNILFPLLFIVIFGIVRHLLRLRRNRLLKQS